MYTYGTHGLAVAEVLLVQTAFLAHDVVARGVALQSGHIRFMHPNVSCSLRYQLIANNHTVMVYLFSCAMVSVNTIMFHDYRLKLHLTETQ